MLNQAPARLPDGIIPAAYIGVDGEKYRCRVPVKEIILDRVEGRTEMLGKHSFTSWHGVNNHLARQAHTVAKGGGYDKFRFQVTWANDDQYEGRFDLQHDMKDPSVNQHILNFLSYVKKTDGPLYGDEEKTQAAQMMRQLDMRQLYPTQAPESWPVVRDYRDEPSTANETPLDLILYDLVQPQEASA
jgi:hypothetical protein